MIEWVINPDGTRGETLNPLGWGCYGPGGTKDKPNRCSYCYAWRIARSRPTNCELCRRFEIHEHRERIFKPLHWKKPRAIFWEDMGDLFHPFVPVTSIEAVMDIVRKTPRHRHIFLTKNPRRLIDYDPFPANAWVGVTATNKEEFDLACDFLGVISASVRFVSCEPILGPIMSSIPLGGIDWIIAGGETHNGRPTGRTIRTWVLDLCSVAGTFGIPIFVKDNVPLFGAERLHEWPRGFAPAGRECSDRG
jgi:protein gp37